MEKRFWFECVRYERGVETRRMVAAYGTINEAGGFEYVGAADGHLKTIYKDHHFRNPTAAVAAERRRTRESIRSMRDSLARITSEYREDLARYRRITAEYAKHQKYLKGKAQTKRVLIVSKPTDE